ncbi:MAG: 2-oxoacid:ferredoxin oxidoreductase subunit beta [Spirochaetota bacterium]|nr:2-oxoacid:ferredoxin oxidoreductase subunit beta [Spirochaetota bacterium]
MKVLENPIKPKEYRSDIEPTWCSGCGDFGVVSAMTKVLSEKQLDPDNIIAVSGIGCSSRLPLWLKTFGFHSAHGRALPVAIGAKIANPELTIFVTIGDGDMFSIGAGHVPHAARRNFDMNVFCLDNNLYALTKNQCSPTSREGKRGSLTPYGTIDSPMNVIELMITYGSTFVAQSYTGNMKHTTEMIKLAVEHKGFSFVNLLSPCPTWNNEETFKYYKERVFDINEEGGHKDFHNRLKALELSEKAVEHYHDSNAKIPIGVFYKEEGTPVFNEKLAKLKEKYAKKFGSTKNPDWNKLFDQYAI